MPPQIGVTVGSRELGLTAGTLGELDDAIGRIGRERAALRIVGILNVLALGGTDGIRRLSGSFLQVLPSAPRQALAEALNADANAIFLEPWQQLLLLKRVFTWGPVDQDGLDFLTPEGERAFFDACRFAAALVVPAPSQAPTDPDNVKNDPHAWLKIAAGFMPTLWMMNPPNPAVAIA